MKVYFEQSGDTTIFHLNGWIDERFSWAPFLPELQRKLIIDSKNFDGMNSMGIANFFPTLCAADNGLLDASLAHVNEGFLDIVVQHPALVLRSNLKIRSMYLNVSCGVCHLYTRRAVTSDPLYNIESMALGFEKEEKCRGYNCEGTNSIRQNPQDHAYFVDSISNLKAAFVQ